MCLDKASNEPPILRCFQSMLFSCSVVSNSLQPHGLQHTRFPCPLPFPWACSNSCPSSQWCYRTISSSVPFSSCPQSFPASGSFLMSLLFVSSGHSVGASVSASVLPMNISGLISSNFDWFDLLSVQGTQESSSAPQFKNINSSVLSLFYCPTHIHTWLPEKTIALTIQTFVGKVMLLLFNMLSSFAIAFLPMSKHLLISWLQSQFTVILELKKIKSIFTYHTLQSIFTC